MRIGITLRPGHEAADAAAAEAHGCFGVLIDGESGTEAIAATAAAWTTRHVRLVVRVQLGTAHPVALAEEMAVLDNISGGRVVILADTGTLTAAEAAEDIGLLAAALSARPVQHSGERWQVPAGIEGHVAPTSIQVTPEPVQIQVPIWVAGHDTAALGLTAAQAVALVFDPGHVDPDLPVQPAISEAPKDITRGRTHVQMWSDAGATHLLLRSTAPEEDLPLMSRYLAPEVAMPDFPRVVAEAMTPAPWPRRQGERTRSIQESPA